jgi:hypothetical protein
VHNEGVESLSNRSSVALFVALTRAVREAPVAEGVRNRAYDIVDRMARSTGPPGFQVELEALEVFAAQEPLLLTMLQPLWKELRALSAASLVSIERAPVKGIDEHRRH